MDIDAGFVSHCREINSRLSVTPLMSLYQIARLSSRSGFFFLVLFIAPSLSSVRGFRRPLRCAAALLAGATLAMNFSSTRRPAWPSRRRFLTLLGVSDGDHCNSPEALRFSIASLPLAYSASVGLNFVISSFKGLSFTCEGDGT